MGERVRDVSAMGMETLVIIKLGSAIAHLLVSLDKLVTDAAASLFRIVAIAIVANCHAGYFRVMNNGL
eukprot:m.96224 g.96224  ORF g.96224 m.96224 type:complete len:68 (+) comp36896_c0_seq3:2772-2975(+)